MTDPATSAGAAEERDGLTARPAAPGNHAGRDVLSGASRPVLMAVLAHHAAHLRPIASALGVDVSPPKRAEHDDDVAVVASYGDLAKARRLGYRRRVLAQHGAGQSYGGDARTARHPAYPGGTDNGDVGLFLVPNEHAADRWSGAYPHARVEVVGCPKIDDLARLGAATIDQEPVVAVSFHWNYHGIPEMRSAFDYYRDAIVDLATRFRVIGHAHPKRRDLASWYAHRGIEYVRDFEDVVRRATVYVCDNSSTLYEFASLGRSTVVLNAPWYRRDAAHGLRFWDAASVGVTVDAPSYLAGAVRTAIDDPLWVQRRRLVALELAYAHRDGYSAMRAANAIRAWAS